MYTDLAAFASLRDPDSRAFYYRKRAEGKKHNAAVICLARRRCDVILAMLRTRAVSLPGAEGRRSRRFFSLSFDRWYSRAMQWTRIARRSRLPGADRAAAAGLT